MNFKNTVLSLALILGCCSDALLVAQPTNQKSELIKKAKTKLNEFKDAMKCVWRKKGCDPKERRKIIAVGLLVVGAVFATAGTVWWFKRRAKPEAPAEPGDAVEEPAAPKPQEGPPPLPSNGPPSEWEEGYVNRMEVFRTAPDTGKNGKTRKQRAGNRVLDYLDALFAATSKVRSLSLLGEVGRALHEAEAALGRKEYTRFEEEVSSAVNNIRPIIEELEASGLKLMR
ncbi:MAG TPA: hypothetical protein ENI27_09005 [bacterium]|nr:hypothetical protein [bacterium]